MHPHIKPQPPTMTGGQPIRLVVFSDDWGRHPSSCQHLIKEILWHNKICCRQGCPGCGEYQVLWVNTLGTRSPGLSRSDIHRAAGKVRSWLGRDEKDNPVEPCFKDDLTVIHPPMWPGFRCQWQRRLNAAAIRWHVEDALGPRRDEQRIAITTLPITADLVGELEVDRWVYYCVDDFSVWPGLDNRVMQTMERDLVEKVDEVVVVSQTLSARIAGMGRESSLLTHGIDLKHWKRAGGSVKPQAARMQVLSEVTGPMALFWGLIDRRLDTAWCRALAEALANRGGTFVLAGPQQSPDPAIESLPGTVMPGAVKYEDLPVWAARADVLVMPYVDEAVTRAMQPLKLKEYLATGKPVVVRDLPSTREWCDAADVVADSQTFVQRVMRRIETGLPESQFHARKRLEHETWPKKARQFSSILLKTPVQPIRLAA